MASAYEIKKQLCDIGERIYKNGFVAANDGNFSVKINANEYYCTPTGVSKGYMTPDMILKVDGQGNMLEQNAKYKPSSEFKMHLRVYEERPDVNAVVHAHPPVATAHAVCGMPLNSMIMPEVIIFLGEVPLTKYGTPSTMEIPDAISEALKNHDAVLLENHGALSLGVDLTQAYFRMETLEYWAKVSLYAQQLGGANELTCEQIEQLIAIRKSMNLPGKHPGCARCEKKGTEACHCCTPAASCSTGSGAPSEAMIREITQRVMASLGK